MKAHVSLCKCVDSPLLPAYIKHRSRPELKSEYEHEIPQSHQPMALQHGQFMLAFVTTKISLAGHSSFENFIYYIK